jgi:hypothetical protein
MSYVSFTIFEVVSVSYIRFKGKAQADPPSLKSYGGTSEKAQSVSVLWRMSVHFEKGCNPPAHFDGLIGPNMRF